MAPEACFVDALEARYGDNYITADLLEQGVKVRMDIHDIQFPDDSFDVVLCNHVLEHVDDDRQAMREIRRVLKPGGWAILLVPILAAETDEDPSVTDPEERIRRFKQHDHVRIYGPDYSQRLRDAGFEVEEFAPDDLLSAEERSTMGITAAAQTIHRCT